KSEKPTETTPTLDQLLNTALRNNPDVQVAEAKLREAEAELRRARLNLAQKLIEQQARVAASREVLAASQVEAEMYEKLRKAGQLPESDYRKAVAQVQRLKAELAQAEGQLNSLAGTVPGLTDLSLWVGTFTHG